MLSRTNRRAGRADGITLLAFELRHAILQYSCGRVIPWRRQFA
jgi:hypothetical protein